MARSIGNARPIQSDPLPAPFRPPVTPETAPQPLTFFSPGKGLNTNLPLNQVPKEQAIFMKNLLMDRGHLATRKSVGPLGGVFVQPCMDAFDFVIGSGTVIPLRFTIVGMEKFDGTNWVAIAGVTFTGNANNYIAVTSFGESLMFSNGVDGLYIFDPTLGAATKITGANVPSAQHLTTFGNRVIATNVIDDSGAHQTRLRWSVKDNSLLWDETDPINLGAGFEDVTASPGPVVDICQATFPFTDQLALLFRLRSVWLISQTGDVDAPFRFSLQFDEIGTESPYSLARIPGGVIGWLRDNFYLISPQGPTQVGTDIADRLFSVIQHPLQLFGRYDPVRQEYRCVVPDDNAIYRYSLREKGWTKDVYPFTPRAVAPTRFRAPGGLTIDQLIGTIDAQVGTIDDLSGTGLVDGMYVVQGPSQGYVTREDPAQTSDINTLGNPVIEQFEIDTGMISTDTYLKKIQVNEVQIEYVSPVFDVTVIVEYSTDGGANWLSFSSVLLTASTFPDIQSIRKTIEARQLQFRLLSSSLAALPDRFQLLGVHIFTEVGALKEP